MPMPDRMRKQSSRWKLHDLNEEKGKQQILQKSLLCVYENISLTNLKCLHIITKDNY